MESEVLPPGLGMREAPESAPSAAAETIRVSTQRADVGSTLNRSRNIFAV